MSNKKPLFQFSLATLLVLMLVAGASLGWYVSGLPIELPVKAVMEYDVASERTETVTEIRNWKTKREVEDAFEEATRSNAYIEAEIDSSVFLQRKQELRRDFGQFSGSALDHQILKLDEAGFLSAAQAIFQNTDDLELAIAMGALLHSRQRPNPAILEELAKRFETKMDSAACNTLFWAYPFQEICKHKVFVTEMRKQLAGPSSSQFLACALSDAGIEHEPWIKICEHRVVNSLNELERHRALATLIGLKPSEEIISESIKALNDDKLTERNYIYGDLIEALLQSEFLNLPGQASSRKIIISRLTALADSSRGDRASESRDFFNLIARYGGAEFETLFTERFRSSKISRQKRIALGALLRLGFEEETDQLIDEAFANNSGVDESTFSLLLERRGKDVAYKMLFGNSKKQPKLWKFVRLVRLADQAQYPGLAGSVESFFKANLHNQYHNSNATALGLLSKLGVADERLEKLRAQIPSIENYCREGDQDVDEVLEWVNKEFVAGGTEETKVTFDQVFKTLEDLLNESTDSLGNADRTWFRRAALTSAGTAAIVEPDFYGTDGYLFDRIAKLAGDEYLVTAQDLISPNTVRMIVNDRLYSFPVDDSCSWYDVVPACEILNTIAKQQRLPGRFFVSPINFGNSYVKFVWFAEPEQSREIVERFDIPVVEGCESYWSGK